MYGKKKIYKITNNSQNEILNCYEFLGEQWVNTPASMAITGKQIFADITEPIVLVLEKRYI